MRGKLIKIVFYFLTLGAIFLYLLVNDLLKWIVAGAAIIYLVAYFSIATISIFTVSLNELGSAVAGLNQKSPLLSIVLLVPMIFLLWLVLLAFWPLFVIPESSLVRNPEKYEAISNFERDVQMKYIYKRDST